MSGALVISTVTLNSPLRFKNTFSVQSSSFLRFVHKFKRRRNRISIIKLIIKMSFAMDKAMMELSLDEEDEPFCMPDLPQFKSCERNARSLIGRILNPDCQKMFNLILNMPRKWQKNGKVRGVALSQERFQFIFNHEHDLEEILEKGVHTFNDWTLAIDRWMENPPPDYLQFIPIWVQIRNIPINYYTEEAITALGDIVGKTIEVAFDPEKPQCQEYVRVLVRFDVSRPLRKTKVVILPEGGSSIVRYNYERIQKRCYECQRLNHEKDKCPIIVRKRQGLAAERRQRILEEKEAAVKFLADDDPLFGVLREDQVGICKETGRRKIAPEVLAEMRRYLMMANGEDKSIRIDRIRTSVADAEKDPIKQKTVLRLESMPIFTKDIDKGKGVVFDFDLNMEDHTKDMDGGSREKLMGSAIRAQKMALPMVQSEERDLREALDRSRLERPASNLSSPQLFKAVSDNEINYGSLSLGGNSTEYGSSSSVIRPSGVAKKVSKPRGRPYIRKRQEQQRASSNILQDLYGNEVAQGRSGSKRKVAGEDFSKEKIARREEERVIPLEGSPKA